MSSEFAIEVNTEPLNQKTMEIAKAKYFVCWDTFANTLYKAKKLQTLFDEVELARDYIG